MLEVPLNLKDYLLRSYFKCKILLGLENHCDSGKVIS